MKTTVDLPDGGRCIITQGKSGPVVTIEDTKGTLYAAFSTDGEGFPCIDISGPEGTPIAVQEYDSVSETTNSITPHDYGSAFNKPQGPVFVTLYERD